MPRPSVPYVVPWTGETTPLGDIVISALGVAYANPVRDAYQADLDGVLWALCGGTQTGGPAYAKELHPMRQKAVMMRPLCAGCKELPERDERGTLLLLRLLDDALDTVWEGVRTVIPPMCEDCADEAKENCPRLLDGHVELRVREAEKVGVRGTLHPRFGESVEPDPDAVVLYDTPDRWLNGLPTSYGMAAAPHLESTP
ncbi:hypothetical protein OG462_42535 [Streptomyces sp. NBC_01077]|uniref:hypothetical protein n=1 Tax=Streptomyces sp. NBC_01077 TaxID=2903746 RepID=UPI00386782D3|nr:hypothetical protein OG462_02485 [Streptomyces sp. NBC_01077]WSV43518.1 hypothetical protein OG462_42535 [Streptomyces sp. NBC_01077]